MTPRRAGSGMPPHNSALSHSQLWECFHLLREKLIPTATLHPNRVPSISPQNAYQETKSPPLLCSAPNPPTKPYTSSCGLSLKSAPDSKGARGNQGKHDGDDGFAQKVLLAQKVGILHKKSRPRTQPSLHDPGCGPKSLGCPKIVGHSFPLPTGLVPSSRLLHWWHRSRRFFPVCRSFCGILLTALAIRGLVVDVDGRGID